MSSSVLNTQPVTIDLSNKDLSKTIDISSSAASTQERIVKDSLEYLPRGIPKIIAEYGALTFSDMAQLVINFEAKRRSEIESKQSSELEAQNNNENFEVNLLSLVDPLPTVLDYNFYHRYQNCFLQLFQPEDNKATLLFDLYLDFEKTIYPLFLNKRSAQFNDFQGEDSLVNFRSDLKISEKLKHLSDILLIADKVISESNSGLSKEAYDDRVKSIRNRLLTSCDNDEGRFIHDALTLFEKNNIGSNP